MSLYLGRSHPHGYYGTYREGCERFVNGRQVVYKRPKARFKPKLKKWDEQKLADALDEHLRKANLLRPWVRPAEGGLSYCPSIMPGSFMAEDVADHYQTDTATVRRAMQILRHRGFRFTPVRGVPHDIWRGPHPSGSGWRATVWQYTLPGGGSA